jgi:hypothetical protein
VIQNNLYYTIGLDLGKKRDPTALALLESDFSTGERRLRGLHRFPLGTPYGDLPTLLEPRLSNPPLAKRVRLAIDASGIGAPIVEQMRRQLPAIDIYAITITAGHNVSGNRRNPNVPKQDLIATTIVTFEQGLLRIAPEMRETQNLTDELLSFRRASTEHDHETYNAEYGQHDDLVLALSLALWLDEERPIPDPNRPTVFWDDGDIPGIVPMGAGINY